MREIEIKAALKHPELFWTAVAQQGITTPSATTQHDLIFVAKPFRLRDINASISPVVRIRNEGDQITLTVKRDRTDQLDSIEHEIVVSDAQQTAAILDALGYHNVLDILKRRQKFQFQKYWLCVDDVDRLGEYIEVEAMVPDDADASSIRREMWNMLHSFGVTTTDEVTKGYDRLLEELTDRGDSP